MSFRVSGLLLRPEFGKEAPCLRSSLAWERLDRGGGH